MLLEEWLAAWRHARRQIFTWGGGGMEGWREREGREIEMGDVEER
jgi:hypothetical protein